MDIKFEFTKSAEGSPAWFKSHNKILAIFKDVEYEYRVGCACHAKSLTDDLKKEMLKRMTALIKNRNPDGIESLILKRH